MRIRFVGSNVQCLVYERSDSETIPAGIDCFYDQGSVGQLGAYHANLDALNQVSVGRTVVVGVGIPGGAPRRVWSHPETQSGGEQSYVSSPSTITLRLGETVRIGSTRIACLYERADIVDVGAAAVACVNDGGSVRAAVGTTDDIFRVTPTTIPDTLRYAIFVSDRVAAILRMKNGLSTLMVQGRHFT